MKILTWNFIFLSLIFVKILTIETNIDNFIEKWNYIEYI
jgi:hypothetical protein